MRTAFLRTAAILLATGVVSTAQPQQTTNTNLGKDANGNTLRLAVGSSRVDLQACKLEYSIVSPK